jgi:hypothetical protein
MRVLKPKDHEPIRSVETHTEHRYRVVLDVAPKGDRRRQVTRTFDSLAQARDFVSKTRAGRSSGTYTAPSLRQSRSCRGAGSIRVSTSAL